MKCWNCGADLPEDALFCSSCGSKQIHEEKSPFSPPEPPVQEGQTSPPPPPPPSEPTPPPYYGAPNGESNGVPSGGNSSIIFVAFVLICAAVYGYRTFRRFVSLVPMLFSWNFSFFWLLSIVLNMLTVIAGVWMCVMLLMLAFKRNSQNTNGLLLCLAGGGVVIIAARLLMVLVNIVNYIGAPGVASTQFLNFILAAIGAVITVAGSFAILRFLLGEPVLDRMDKDALMFDLQQTFNSFSQTAADISAQASQSAQEAKARREAQQQAQQQASYTYQQGPQYGRPQPGQVPPPPGYAPLHVKADRSLIAYILLTIVTCGIYGLYFIYALARDVNVVCGGDGKSTAGLLKYYLLTIVTCGIYPIFWIYGLGNRLAANAPRYGMTFQENGTTVLLWQLLGALLCGIGPFVAMNIIIKNTNALCGAYNYSHGI